ncbi:MAG: DNA mismatch repair protein MutS [Rhodobacteraceae bacterium]|nr:DNA mismatch repair protein MutS [Paracoccaceae bacterium]
MMAQFLDIKSGYPDALLFYRMGDFYELFFDDAVAAAAALDIALTKRGKHLGADIPMCGVPVHSAENYLLTLIRKGFRVAVCEQLEDPAEAKKRGSKAVVKRDVVRLVTPGTLTEETLLDARRHNYLASYAVVRDAGALGWTDISTGAFQVMSVPRAQLAAELARLGPREVLVSEANYDDLAELVSEAGASVTPLSRASFDSTSAEKRLTALFSVQTLEAFAGFERAEVAAMGAIVDYLAITQKGQLPMLRQPQREETRDVVQIDAATRRNLELTRTLAGDRAGALLGTIDRTVTAAGGRLLEGRLSAPSRKLDLIKDRHDAIAHLVTSADLRESLRAHLRRAPDLDRALSRLALDRGGPRDLAAVRDALAGAADIADRLQGDLPNALARARAELEGHETLQSLLEAALVAEPPVQLRDGGFVAPGYDSDLDDARQLRDEGRGMIAAMQSEFADRTGIASLKIKHNNVLGYFIETTATHAQKMLSAPLSEIFIHRQTTANAVRFTTVDLSDLETRILNAGARVAELENRLYSTLKQAILDRASVLHPTAHALAEIDVSAGLADLAVAENWCRPVVDESRAFAITGGRHPVVERALLSEGGAQFVRNSCDLTAEDGAAIWLVTGPNMAGKSTFLRQNAIIALLAQAGSYVPAESAEIGLVSQIFSRVGASDDLARGRSTFMVEMVETAAILNQADDRALVILDEIGRGTATYDGLSIAWATLEHLHDANRARALFATHYHEMTALADTLDGVRNATVAVKDWEGEIVFLHEVRMGAADRSYGVQVAKLAGLPEPVIARARQVLDLLEKTAREGGSGAQSLVDDLPLFSATPPPPPPPTPKTGVELDALLAEIHPDELTPREALDLVYRLKQALTQANSSRE